MANKNLLFSSEENILEKSKLIIESSDYKENLLLDDFIELVRNYEKTLNEYKKIVKISDNFERSLRFTEERLRKVNETKTQLIQIAVHDLQSPISLITGFSKMLINEGNLNDKQNDFLKTITKASEWMYQLINEIMLDIQIEDEEFKVKYETIDAKEIIKKVINRNKVHANQKEQKIIFSPDSDNKYIVKTNTNILSEILNNLISNAVKYSDYKKNIWVSIKQIPITDMSSWIQFEVKDEGPGFTDEDKKNIYKKFKRLSAVPTGDEPSVGLGLYLTKKLVEILNGKISLLSDSEKGSTFLVNLLESE